MITKIPFERFIIMWLLLGKNILYIIEKLKGFGYYITEDEISEIFERLLQTLPETLREKVESKIRFDTKLESEIQWLKQFGIFEFYDYIIRKDLKNK